MGASVYSVRPALTIIISTIVYISVKIQFKIKIMVDNHGKILKLHHK